MLLFSFEQSEKTRKSTRPPGRKAFGLKCTNAFLHKSLLAKDHAEAIQQVRRASATAI
jgi:hypothetical protein